MLVFIISVASICARDESLKSQDIAFEKYNYQNVFIGVSLSTLTISALLGIYNIRNYNQILHQCMFDYGLNVPVYIIDYPLQFLHNLICVGEPMLDETYQKKHGQCLTEIDKKINLFDGVNCEIIWNFQYFKDTMPHTDFNNAYCIAKNYLGSFGYPTIGHLKYAIDEQIAKIEIDYKKLISLTDLPWYYLSIPRNFVAMCNLEQRLSTFSDYHGIYSFLGAFGYSAEHNGQRIKTVILAVTKIYAFLLNFQELLATCIADDSTQLIAAPGVIEFSIQHVHQISLKK